ncbi:hypothetical protein HYC85_020284 [Camellia sinensis]|uniref:Calponin-homology (CH) domain-containing protein n=1 Tax=Camellia sinensis TaxID=4442 RepID=A0A7J7GPB4_CAMSI|nr:hypothetical protein HYC85_020284 [Camellia sinensis]
MGLISQMIKKHHIQLLADLNLKKTPQLLELVDDSKKLMGLPPEKVLLKWMNFQLKKAGYKILLSYVWYWSKVREGLCIGEAYAHLLNALAPEHGNASTLDTKDPTERAILILEHAERMDCKRYVTSKDIVKGSTNLNLAFVVQIFQQSNGLSMDTKNMFFAKMMMDDAQTSREERCF